MPFRTPAAWILAAWAAAAAASGETVRVEVVDARDQPVAARAYLWRGQAALLPPGFSTQNRQIVYGWSRTSRPVMQPLMATPPARLVPCAFWGDDTDTRPDVTCLLRVPSPHDATARRRGVFIRARPPPRARV